MDLSRIALIVLLVALLEGAQSDHYYPLRQREGVKRKGAKGKGARQWKTGSNYVPKASNKVRRLIDEDIDLLSTEYAEGCAVGYGKKSGGKKAGGKKAGGKKSGEGTTAGKKGGRRKRSLLCECGPEGEGPCPDDDAIEIIELDDLLDGFDDFVEPQGPLTGEDADIFEEPQGPLTGEDPVPNAVDDNDESISNEGTSLSVPWADDGDESISNEGVDILGQGEDDDNDDDDDESISNEGTSIGLDVETDVEDRDGLNGGFFLDLPPPIELDEGDEDYEVTNEDFKPPTNEDYAG